MASLVINNTDPFVSYAVGGTPQSVFTIPPEIGFFDLTDIKVFDGDTELTYDVAPADATEFSVSGTAVDGGYQGGTVTLGASVSNTTIKILRDVPIERTTDFPSGPNLNIPALNTQLDRVAAWMQQLNTRWLRSVRLDDSDPTTGLVLPDATERANCVLGFGADGSLIVVAGYTPDTVTVSTFMATVLDDSDGPTALATLGAAALSVLTTAGDIIVRGASTWGRLALGASGQVPTSNGSTLVYADVPLPRGYIDGFILSNNGTDANNDLDIAAGAARDSTDAANIKLASALTKRLDAAWAAGTNQGGLDTGTEATSTWYHVWAIKNPTTGTVDVLFSASATAPTMPSDYTLKRRIGAVYNDGSGNLKAFVQSGELFYWVTPVLDVDASDLSTTEVEYTLTVPTGVRVRAHFTAETSTTDRMVYIHPTDVTDAAPSDSAAPLSTLDYVNSGGGVFAASMDMWMLTSTTGKIAARAEGNGVLRVATRAWIDARGKDA